MPQNLDFGSINVINVPLARAKLGIQNVNGGGGVPPGGTTGQSLVKLSNANFNTGWATISGGGGSPNLDGGAADTTYGAVSPIDGGGA